MLLSLSWRFECADLPLTHWSARCSRERGEEREYERERAVGSPGTPGEQASSFTRVRFLLLCRHYGNPSLLHLLEDAATAVDGCAEERMDISVVWDLMWTDRPLVLISGTLNCEQMFLRGLSLARSSCLYGAQCWESYFETSFSSHKKSLLWTLLVLFLVVLG